MPATQSKTPEQIRTEIGDAIDTARRDLIRAARQADLEPQPGMRRVHQHLLGAVAALDDALSMLAEGS